jgi:hypothetical protein
MFKQALSLVLVGLLAQASLVTPAAAKTKGEARKHAARVKAAVAKLGTGESARAEVELLDKTRLEGYVREAGEVGFVLVDAGAGTATTVPYTQVGRVKGNNLSTGQKVLIGLGIAAGVMLFLALLIDD